MKSVQGKMKLDIVFDPRDKEKNDWPIYQRSVESYIAEWRCEYVLTANYTDYESGSNADQLKRFNHGIIERWLTGTLKNEALAIAKAHDNNDRVKNIWDALILKYDRQEVADQERVMDEWYALDLQKNEKVEKFIERLKEIADRLQRLGRERDNVEKVYKLRKILLRHKMFVFGRKAPEWRG